MNGVVATRAGWVGGDEVVEVTFDPLLLSRADLEKSAFAGCARKKFVTGTPVRAAEDQKYYLSQSPLRAVPMTSAQAARIHASLQGKDAQRWLSPRQREAALLIQGLTDHPWESLVGVPLDTAWTRLRAQYVAALARQSAQPTGG